jgi:hypothetical protein
MIDVKMSDFKARMDGPYIKGIRLTALNIGRFNLYKMTKKSTESEMVYRVTKNSRGYYIVHNIKHGIVEWHEKLK